MIPCS